MVLILLLLINLIIIKSTRIDRLEKRDTVSLLRCIKPLAGSKWPTENRVKGLSPSLSRAHSHHSVQCNRHRSAKSDALRGSFPCRFHYHNSLPVCLSRHLGRVIESPRALVHYTIGWTNSQWLGGDVLTGPLRCWWPYCSSYRTLVQALAQWNAGFCSLEVSRELLIRLLHLSRHEIKLDQYSFNENHLSQCPTSWRLWGCFTD